MGYAKAYPKPEKQPKELKKLVRKMALDVNKLGFKGSYKRKPIKKVSRPMSKKLAEYSRLKKLFFLSIFNHKCPIYPHLPVTDIHHQKGRVGDLLLDTRYWLAVSRKGHIKIELNPKWALENGYSLPRS